MTESRLRPVRSEHRPELKQLVTEASRALATLDAERLEELALSCQALNRDLKPATAAERLSVARQAREAAGDLAVFGRVLEATRANLKVMRRLRQLHEGRFGYGDPEFTGNVHGHD
jgi:hypothetical protein